MHPRRRVTVAVLAAGLTAGGVAAAPVAGAAPTAAAAGPIVVASGLNNPRALSFLPDGSVLLVAEAGAGGPDCNGTSPEGDPTCFGPSGAVDAVLSPGTARDVAPTTW